jgi:hypothetical protein
MWLGAIIIYVNPFRKLTIWSYYFAVRALACVLYSFMISHLINLIDSWKLSSCSRMSEEFLWEHAEVPSFRWFFWCFHDHPIAVSSFRLSTAKSSSKCWLTPISRHFTSQTLEMFLSYFICVEGHCLKSVRDKITITKVMQIEDPFKKTYPGMQQSENISLRTLKGPSHVIAQFRLLSHISRLHDSVHWLSTYIHSTGEHKHSAAQSIARPFPRPPLTL